MSVPHKRTLDQRSNGSSPTNEPQSKKQKTSETGQPIIRVVTQDCTPSITNPPPLETEPLSLSTNASTDIIDITSVDDDTATTRSTTSNATSTHIPPSPAFLINQSVQLYRDNILHTGTIIQAKPESSLYLVHYNSLQSIYDEWVPSHKLTPITSTQSNAPPNPSPPSSPDLISTNSLQLEPNSPEQLNSKLLSAIPSPARAFSFELDTFQLKAILSLEQDPVNLLITAHTSAGKTVIAEYAIAMALARNQRVIYTSPIKALSNQKYREFTEKFDTANIGLITGDVTKRPNASVLVMTTEILRNMLYKENAYLREVAFVIFDEVHYMRDAERGVVWEESIILLPRKMTLIFLSATLSNSDDFAAWVSSLKHKECRVIGTEQRPIVLEHYVFPGDNDALFMVASSAHKNTFLDENFDAAMNSVKANARRTNRQIMQKQTLSKLKVNRLQLLLYMLYKQKWCPAIVFAFSKREVEGHAMALNDAINFCSKEESDVIEQVFSNAIDALSEKDQKLPAVTSLLPLLKKGIGVHHGGILPILKEVTEILFQEGLIRVLFATETFAMGVNMPAKCVVFTAIEKYDGIRTRLLESSEYIQMSGRAGRRGIDERGVVVLMLGNKIAKDDCKRLMCGKAGALTSSFRLTYNMLLNISKSSRDVGEKSGDKVSGTETSSECVVHEVLGSEVGSGHGAGNVSGTEGGDVLMVREESLEGAEAMERKVSYMSVIEQSFYRFLMTQRIPQIEARTKELRDVLNRFEEDAKYGEKKIYFDLYDMKRRIMDKAVVLQNAPYILNDYLEYGRVVFVSVPAYDSEDDTDNKTKGRRNDNDESVAHNEMVWGWGVVMAYAKRHQPDVYFVDVLLPCKSMEGQLLPQPIDHANVDLLHVLDMDTLNSKLDKVAGSSCGLAIARFNTRCIKYISSIRVNRLSPVVAARQDVYRRIYDPLHAIETRFCGEIPRLDPLKDLDVLTRFKLDNKLELKQEFEERLPKLEERMKESKFYQTNLKDKTDPQRLKLEQTWYQEYGTYRDAKKEFGKLTRKISSYNLGQFAKELKCKCRVLQKLKYINQDNILTSKGTAASYLEVNHEILIVELMFDNFFDSLTSREVCPILSVFVNDSRPKPHQSSDTDKRKIAFPIPDKVNEAFNQVLGKAREVLNVKRECGLTYECGLFDNIGHQDEDDYLQSLNPNLMKAIFQWVNGVDFVDVNKLTSLYEGSLIRVIKRLRDVVNQLMDAAKAIGNDELMNKFSQCVDHLQRGIVFAASLYVDGMDDDEEEDNEDDEDDSMGDKQEKDEEDEVEAEDVDMEQE